MKRLALALCFTALAAFGQYKVESAGAPPSDVAPDIRAALEKDGAKIIGPKGAVCELWFRAQAPNGSNSESNATITSMPHGALLGVIRYPAQGSDRRGQTIKPGVYTLRLSFHPVDGAHQGVALQRDFALLVPASDDKDLNATPDYKQLVEMSKKASGTPHPAILGIWKADEAKSRELKQEGDDWVLYDKVGDTPIAIIVVGAYQG